MSDFRQCVRCGRMDAIPGAALDSAHKCGHGFRCEAIPGLRVVYCQWCAQDRIREAKIAVEKSLPGAFAALMSATGGVPDPTALARGISSIGEAISMKAPPGRKDLD